MTKQLIVGFCAEGSTDERFLTSVIQRTFEEVAFECTGQIDILPVQFLEKETGPFNELVQKYATKAIKSGIMVLCIHTDADAPTDDHCFNNKINPAFEHITNLEEDNICKNLVAVVPIHMTESWMLAEKELLKKEIGTNKSDNELGINRDPESITNPKHVIETAISIMEQDLTKKRRRQLKIGQLYLPIGQKIQLQNLESLISYNKFKSSVEDAFRELNYLQ